MIRWILAVAVLGLSQSHALAQPKGSAGHDGPAAAFSQILGRPTDRAVTLSLLSSSTVDAFVEYGTSAARFAKKTPTRTIKAGEPAEFEIEGLTADTAYFYRVRTKAAGDPDFTAREEATFHTQRKPTATFTFAIQGDSHPERLGKMFDPDLYERTMSNVAADKPDFYFLMGDDFSIERLIERGTKRQDAVNAIYAYQRGFLGLVGRSSPIMLVNGNHEQAAKYLLDGKPDNFAVFAGKARTAFFPLPAPPKSGQSSIYSGNEKPVEHIGLLRDYYAWEWGDALFVVIDPYWHSDVPVDNEAGTKAPQRDAGRDAGDDKRDGKRRNSDTADEGAGGKPDDDQPGNRRGKGNRDFWQITLGDEQYQWLRNTLTRSKAKFKFVFSHHVLGTGRGGIEQAKLYEWGGDDRHGVDRFHDMRPKWQQPIHDLMRDTGVTIFFQGHDHLYARQELDGVIYQTCPNPADPTFTAFNRQAYKSGDIFPNSGHLRVTVTGGDAPTCKVEYVRSLRPSDEKDGHKNGTIVHSYVAKPRTPKLRPSGDATP